MFKKKDRWQIRQRIQDKIPLRGQGVSKAGSISRKIDKTDLISSVDIERNGVPYASVDQIAPKLKLYQPLIVNTDLSSGPGQHWIVAYCVPKTAVIFDSLGAHNFRPNDVVMWKQLKSKGYETTFWRGQSQYDDSVQCGWFSLYTAKILQKHKPKTVDQAVDVVEHYLGKEADDGDIKKIIKAFGMAGKNRIDKDFDKF